MYILAVCDNSSMLNTILFIKNIISIIFVVVPIVLVLLFTIDLFKNVFSHDDKDNQKNLKLGVRRVIYSLVLLFVPLLVETFMGMIDNYSKVADCYTIATEAKVKELYDKEEKEYQEMRNEKLNKREEEKDKVKEENKEQEKSAKGAEKKAQENQKKEQEKAQKANTFATNSYTSTYTKADVPGKYIQANGKVAQAAGPSHPLGKSYPYSLYDAKSGDQTGNEVLNGKMHNGWTYVARFKDPTQANLMALCMGNATANNHIGYDGNKATTLFYEAKKYGFDVSKVTKDVDTTCSNLVCVCINYAGTSFPDSASCRGNHLYNQLSKRSSVFTVKKYSAGMTVYRGDILFTGVHTGVAL